MSTARSLISYDVTDVEGPVQPLSTGAMFPASASVRFLAESDDDDTVVTVTLRVIEGSPTLVGVAIGSLYPPRPREIRATDIHTLPIAELTRRAIRAVTGSFADERTGPGRGDGATEAEAALRALRRRAITDALLSDVARVYLANPDDPARQVSVQLHTSERTAGRWIREARQRVDPTTERTFLPAISRKGASDGNS